MQQLKNNETPMNWPSFFPNKCPPDNAEHVNKSYFRLVKTNPPTSADVLSNKELQPEKDWGSSTCKACGLSIFIKREDAEKTRKRIPALRETHIAIARVTKDSGVVAETPSRDATSHCTWWLAMGFHELCLLLLYVEQES